jgi:hypothetical protein
VQVLFILALPKSTTLKHLFTIITLILFAATSFGQTKKEYYYDTDWKAISRNEFYTKSNDAINIKRKVENDTIIMGKLFTRRVYAKLPQDSLQIIHTYLSKIAKKEIDASKIIALNYYPDHKPDNPNLPTSMPVSERQYIKKLHKITPEAQQFRVYKYDDKLTDKKENWVIDEDAVIEHTFFPYYFMYGSVVIIHPSGNYYIYYGEYGVNQVIEGLNELIKRYGN